MGRASRPKRVYRHRKHGVVFERCGYRPPYTFPGATGAPEQPNNAATFAADIWNPLKALSTSLGGLANNGTFNTTTGVFTPGPGPGPTVWNLTTTQLQSFANNMIFPSCFSSVPGPPTCDGVVNVTGPSYSNTFTFNPLFPLPGIIFKFEDATSISIGNAWEASILAPFANIRSSAFIEGNVIANSIGGSVAIGSEIHNDLFDCSDNLCTPTTVPEPGSLMLLGTLLFAFWLLLHLPLRRRVSKWRCRIYRERADGAMARPVGKR